MKSTNQLGTVPLSMLQRANNVIFLLCMDLIRRKGRSYGSVTLILAETCSHMQSASCALGDFNSMLDVEDRLGENIFTSHKKEEFTDIVG